MRAREEKKEGICYKQIGASSKDVLTKRASKRGDKNVLKAVRRSLFQ
jgi:hypothetical protein